MQLHSGSDDVLRAMPRSYGSERFLAILSRVRYQIPDAAITTDIIVGFPTQTEADDAETLRVADTLRVVEASRFSRAPRRRAPPSHPALIPPSRTSPPRASPASAHAAPGADTQSTGSGGGRPHGAWAGAQLGTRSALRRP